MADPVVTRSIHLLAQGEAVWNALTVPELVSEWFGDGSLLLESAQPPSRVDYRRSTDAGLASSIVITLEPSRHGTDVTVTDTGESSLSVDDWSSRLTDLEAFLDRQDSI
jgi:hypothetical protein